MAVGDKSKGIEGEKGGRRGELKGGARDSRVTLYKEKRDLGKREKKGKNPEKRK